MAFKTEASWSVLDDTDGKSVYYNKQISEYQTKPTSSSHQAMWLPRDGNDTFGQDVKIIDNKIFASDPGRDEGSDTNAGKIYFQNTSDITNSISNNTRLSHSNKQGFIGDGANEVMGTGGGWDVGHGILVYVNPNITSQCNYYAISNAYDFDDTSRPVVKKTFNVYDASGTAASDTVGVAVGNHRVYVLYEAASVQRVNSYLLYTDKDGTYDDAVPKVGTGGNQGEEKNISLGSAVLTADYTHIHAKDGLVLAGKDGFTDVYTADLSYLGTLANGGDGYNTVDLGSNRIAAIESGTVYIYDYNLQPIGSITNPANGTTPASSVAVGNDMILVCYSSQSSPTGLGNIANGGAWYLFDLDGNVLTDYGQTGGVFWAFGLVTSNDFFGTSCAMGNGYMAIGAPSYLDNDPVLTGFNNSRDGGVLVYKIPQTFSTYMQEKLEYMKW